jgi:hypothetical protein
VPPPTDSNRRPASFRGGSGPVTACTRGHSRARLSWKSSGVLKVAIYLPDRWQPGFEDLERDSTSTTRSKASPPSQGSRRSSRKSPERSATSTAVASHGVLEVPSTRKPVARHAGSFPTPRTPPISGSPMRYAAARRTSSSLAAADHACPPRRGRAAREARGGRARALEDGLEQRRTAIVARVIALLIRSVVDSERQRAGGAAPRRSARVSGVTRAGTTRPLVRRASMEGDPAEERDGAWDTDAGASFMATRLPAAAGPAVAARA